MNKARRKRLREANELLDQAMNIVSECAEEERVCYDNLPESLQYAEAGERMSENADSLEEVPDSIQDIIDQIAEITEAW